MKKKNIEYIVHYDNGHIETFYCSGITSAIILAQYYALQEGLNIGICKITDKEGNEWQHITVPQAVKTK